jgi:CheY-like chemotaxis protein
MIDSRTRTVLIVDDELDFRETLAFEFQRKGFQVLHASNVAEAEQFLSSGVDLILSDMNMPGGTGLDFVERLRASGSKLPFLLFISDDAIRPEEALRRGADLILSKPFDRKALMESIEKLLKKK